MIRSIIALIIFFAVFSTNVHAGGAAKKMQGQRGMKQKQMMQQQQTQQQQAIMEQRRKQQAMQKARQQAAQTAPAEVKEVVTLNQVLSSFEQSSRAWPLIIDKEAKEFIDQINPLFN